MPPELFERPGFSLKPEAGRSGPKLWVRRLVIWREPKVVIRDIPLRPGLNVIWSPDSLEADSPIGHGGGKTTFCRLLRFCLGEETFAPQTLRQRIGEVFPKGHVGAEVILDGHLWIVVRSLGHRRRDFVQHDGQLDDAFQEASKSTGMGPLIDALTDSVLGAAAALMPRSIGADDAWKALLAWMTRDQECRFAHALDWRSSDSHSRSPVVNRSAEDKLLVVRAAIGALSKNEMDAQVQEEQQKEKLTKQRSLISHLDWQIRRMRRELSTTLAGNRKISPGIPGTPIDVALWRSAADERLSKALNLPGRSRPEDVLQARRERDQAKEEFDRLTGERKRLDEEIALKEEMTGILHGELPEAHARLQDEQNPVCPICKVPIDKALAEGCGISTETCDLHALQKEIAQKRGQIAEMGLAITGLHARKPALKSAIPAAEQRFKAANEALGALEKLLDSSSKSIRTAQRLREDVDLVEALTGELDSARLKERNIDDGLEKIRESLAKFRDSSSGKIRRLSTWFDVVLRELVPGDVQSSARIDGNGLKLNVKMGGDRSTAAIDSLKVVAFDLAILAMSMEHTLFVPGVLVHDSPREADLSEKVYRRLFSFAAMLEQFGKEPYFQYILTTTTTPPERFQTLPWLRLSVIGAPAEKRLLGVDL